MTAEIKKLQMLNDLVAQTLEALNQRATAFGGLSHTPYSEIGSAFGVPIYGYGPTGVPQVIPQVATGVPFGSITGQVPVGPFVNPLAFGQVPVSNPLAFGQVPVSNPLAFGQVPVLNPLAFSQVPPPAGLMHSPAHLAQQFGYGPVGAPQLFGGGAFQIPIVAPIGSGLSHTPFVHRGIETGLGAGLGYIDPRLAMPVSPWAPLALAPTRFGFLW